MKNIITPLNSLPSIVRFIVFVFLSLVMNLTLNAQIYVNQAASGANNGTSWANAYTDLQPALDAASSSQEVLIAQGTYKPTEAPDGSNASPRDKAFHFNTDILIEGGYDPITGTPTGAATILSGDIDVVNDASDNVYHVMVNTGLTAATVLENLTFRDGNADGASSNDMAFGGTTFDRRYGGGIYSKSSQPTYSNCVFTNNQATVNGGGLYLTSSDATVIDCDFTSNTAANGGGIGNAYSSSSTISNSTFRSNIATGTGGGVANIFSAQTIITNCVLVENEANDGGGIANSGTTIDIINCSLTANSTTNSAALFASTTTNISNTILWGNGSEIDGTVMINNSIVEGGYTGCTNCPNTDGNIDPLFVDAADPDGLDDIMGTADDGINFMISSQAINAGSSAGAPSTDITGDDRTANPDIGAYEAETCHDNLVFVSASAMGNNTGSSWLDAYTDLQAALDQAMDCGVDSILVAEGIYYPTSSPDESTANPRDKAFHINTDIVLEGGYDPLTGTQTGGGTILSGDIDVVNDASDNVYHVMVNTGLTAATVLENLTFRDGNADGASSNDMAFGGTTFDRRYGGGIYSKSSDPIYSNCVFINNTATENGGGLYLTTSDATVNDCLFRSNSADNGGGLGNAWSSSSTISRSIFDSNMALSSGGGMANILSSQTTVTNCAFIDNSAVNGGGVANSGTSTDIINCTITSNSASGSGGSILSTSTTNITNSISWGNGSEIDGSGSVMINNSIVEGGYTGCVDCPNTDGNIDPLFVDAADADGLDDIMGTADDGIRLKISSQAINAGSSTGAPSTDITGADRTEIPDIGAYEKETCHDNLVFVSASALGNNTGSSWPNAFNDLQEALDQTMICDVDSILVAEGTYYPTSSPDESTTNPRDRAFHLNINVVVKGGYDPLTGNQDGEASILSGDIGILADSLDNTFHVMITTDLDQATTFNNLTFQDGNANVFNTLSYSSATFARSRGAGVYNLNSSPILTNCTFTSNNSSSGGGMYNSISSSPTLTNCTFKSNSAGIGGGMYNTNSSSPTLTNCNFTSNNFSSNGSGMYNTNSSPTLTNCTFKSNSAGAGAGMFNTNSSSPTLINCTFTSNSASARGGGMYNTVDSSPTLTNCNFTSNSAEINGGGMRNLNPSSITLTNCTFTSNIAPSGGGIANSFSAGVSLTDCTFYVPISSQGIINENNATTTIRGTVEIIKNYVTDNEGNPYKTIQIGTQNWMAENLNIGTMIDGIETQTDNGTFEKYCYDNNPANCDIYGGLYKWDEMMQYTTLESSQGICPSGWHLPSDDELKTLEMTLGMTQAEADMLGDRGTDQGSQLAGNEPLWTNGALDQNAAFGNSGFAALAGGLNNTSGFFTNQSLVAYFWSSSGSGDSAWHRDLHYTSPMVNRLKPSKSFGLSVRCVQD